MDACSVRRLFSLVIRTTRRTDKPVVRCYRVSAAEEAALR